ncbi:MAG TPA: diguanylate cyclase [Arenimonas sp.]|nr:diguanylate cyclase [Arenimonas sp.]
MPKSIFFGAMRSLLLTFLCLLFSPASFAADAVRWDSLRQPYFQHIPLDGPVSAFAQDREGFIWLVAGNVLWRWDAYQLAAAIAPANEAPLIIQTIKSDPDGEIWVGTGNGLFRLPHYSLHMQRVSVQALNSISIQHLAFDYSSGRKRVFIGGINKLFEWNMDSGVVITDGIGGTENNRIHALQLDRTGQLWLGTTEGLQQKTISGPASESLHPSTLWPDNTRVASLFTDQANKLWIGTTKYGLFLLDGKRPLEKIELPTYKTKVPWIYAINEIRPGMFWLGTFGNGILEYDSVRKTFKAIQSNRLLKTGLRDDNVWTLFRDRRGLIWTGGGQGIDLYDATQTAFTNIPGDIDEQGLSDAKIHAVLAMPDDQVWLGTEKHGIDIIHPLRSDVGHIPAGISGDANLSTDPIEAMMLADPENILASSNWLSFIIDRQSHAARFLRPEGRAPDAYSSAFANYRGSTWVAGTDGLWRIPDIRKNSAKNVFSSLPGERRIASLFSDDDVLWLGTWKGLKQLSEDPAPPFAIHVKSIAEPELDQQFITSMAKDVKKRLWFGTSNAGLFINTREGMAAKTGWKKLSEANGLPSNVIASIQMDQRGDIWVSTSRGIAHIALDSLKVDGILANEGAAAAPYTRAAGSTNASGDIIFGGAEGVTVVQPAKWRSASYKPGIVLTGIETNTDKTMLATTTSASDGKQKARVRITPEVNRLTIEFAALDYLAADRIRYRYRLSGFDEHWRETDAMHRAASFTSLAPDRYEMQVQYSYDGREWLDSSLSLTVDVLPAWYQRWWVRLLLLAFFAWLLLQGIAWRTRLYRERQRVLEQKVAERTSELEGANRLLQEKSHEIEEASLTDPLTGLRNRRFLTRHIDADTSLVLRRYQDHSDARKMPPQNADLIFYLIDIDNFKRVNDSWGHAVGDAVLIEMRRRLMSVFRNSDYIVRWGGEEFLAVARDTSREKSVELAERIRQAVVSEQFPVAQGRQISVSCSVGYAVFPFVTQRPDVFTWSETLAIADAALYKAKEMGRDIWVGADTAGIELSEQEIAGLKLHPESIFNIQAIKIQATSKTNSPGR